MEELAKLPSRWSDWSITDFIGSGSYGEVYKAVNKTDGREAAVKIIRIPNDDAEATALAREYPNDNDRTRYFDDLVEHILEEIRAMEKLKDNENVVTIYDACLEHEEGSFIWTVYIMMELLTSLPDYLMLHPVDEELVLRLGTDMCNALAACEEKNILHRDIKPENIMVARDGTFKLGDFGVAKQLGNASMSMSVRGSFTYMAPEVYHGEKYGANADRYSLALVLYKLLNDNRDPFTDPEAKIVYYKDREDALRKRMAGDPLLPPANASPRTTTALLRGCAYEPEKRYKYSEQFGRALQSCKHKEESSEAGAAGETTIEPAAEPVTEPTAEPVTEPAAEPTAEPAAETTPEPAAKPTTEPAAEPTTEPATESTPHPRLSKSVIAGAAAAVAIAAICAGAGAKYFLNGTNTSTASNTSTKSTASQTGGADQTHKHSTYSNASASHEDRAVPDGKVLWGNHVDESTDFELAMEYMDVATDDGERNISAVPYGFAVLPNLDPDVITLTFKDRLGGLVVIYGKYTVKGSKLVISPGGDENYASALPEDLTQGNAPSRISTTLTFNIDFNVVNWGSYLRLENPDVELSLKHRYVSPVDVPTESGTLQGVLSEIVPFSDIDYLVLNDQVSNIGFADGGYAEGVTVLTYNGNYQGYLGLRDIKEQVEYNGRQETLEDTSGIDLSYTNCYPYGFVAYNDMSGEYSYYLDYEKLQTLDGAELPEGWF